ALERKLKKEGRYEEFRGLIRESLELEWEEVQNDPLVVDSMLPEIAHQMYPDLFKTPDAFSAAASDFIRFEDERVREMLEIIRDASGKERILFIVDELGQYVGGRQQLILNLQGLAQNLKNIGDGKVWLIGAAQQTLTEDDPRAVLNAPELFRLKDRFPIRIDLESSDIREICYRRLLAKSPGGETLLGEQFDRCGQELRRNTRLQDARFYDSDFNRETFINLYPFLPAHFDILLHLLGALAKSTGGVGLRSAIKVIQDILIEGDAKAPPAAERPVGWLATTDVLYDALEKDIERAFPAMHQSVEKTKIRSGDLKNAGRDEVLIAAKSVAVLQILGNLPVTVHNVAGLAHPGVDAPGRLDHVKRAVDAMLKDAVIPLGEQNANLR
ncbi:MAG: BREX system P-loop protein BrxC, partial [Desulfobacterales bacterium]|nr:BREX system P-loop protein BrxC [Desulfobacterales bacterium]